MEATSITLKNAYFLYTNDDVKRSVADGKIDYGFFELKEIDSRLEQFKLVGPDISAHFDHLAFTQYTGFRLMNLSGDFRLCPTGLTLHNAALMTPTSRLFLDFAFEYNSFKDYSDFLNKIRFNVKMNTSTADMHDISYFVPQTAGMDNRLVLSCHVTGPVNRLSVSEMDARFADSTHLMGDLILENVTDFMNARISADFEHCTVDMAEIQSFRLPQGKTIELPEQVAKLGTAYVDLSYAGVVSDDFDVSAHLRTVMGDVTAKLSTTVHKEDDGVDYSAMVDAKGLQLKRLLPKLNMLGAVSGRVEADGKVGNLQDFTKTLSAKIKGNLASIYVKGYPLRDIRFTGNYASRRVKADVSIFDPNCELACNGNIDLSGKDKDYKLSATIDHILPNRMFAHLPQVDSNAKDGFDKFVRYVQKHPEVALSIASAECDMQGSNLDNLTGTLFIDGLSYQQDSLDLVTDRLRLIMMPGEDRREFRFSSDLFNASLATQYPLKELPEVLLNTVYTYIGNLLPERELKQFTSADGTGNRIVDLNVTTYHLQPVLNMFAPNISIADNSMVKITTSEAHTHDRIQVHSSHISIGNGLNVNNFIVEGSQSDTARMKLYASVSNLVVGEKKNFVFDDIVLQANMGKQQLDYDLKWKNPAVISSHNSVIAGVMDFKENRNIEARVSESEIYLKEFPFTFNQDHLITIGDGNVKFDNLQVQSFESKILLNGRIGAQDDLTAVIDNFDIDVVNQYIKTDKMALDGNLSANMRVRKRGDNRYVTGTAIIKDFSFNGEEFGYLYANALVPSDMNIRFRGGLINPQMFPDSATVFNYTYEDFKKQPGVNTHLNGNFNSEKKRLTVNANIDTLKLGFLEPMLASFSHKFTGNASGDITFVMDKDSLYFDGVADIHHAQIGISSLNTIYNIDKQKVVFNQEGFLFNHMMLTDQFNNSAEMNGYVKHTNFQNFAIDLKISTPKIFVLNTKQEDDTPFYGDAFVSGDVSIFGNTSKLSFHGNNIETKKGTVFCLPISFADKAVNSDVITFTTPKRPQNDDEEEVEEEDNYGEEMELDFDFTLKVTPDAIIKLDMDLSAFGGNINTTGEGTVRFTYNTKTDINMLGDVQLHSGTFVMNFAQLMNKKFDLQPGGTVTFDGDLDHININVKALYSTTAYLGDLFTSENTNVRRLPVKAYLLFNGNLNDPAAIDFAFELPNATSDFKNSFYNVIDTTNIQNKTEQFFSLVMLGKFVSSQSLVSNFNIENTGIGVLTSTLSNFISRQLKFVDVNLNYNAATEDKSAEYSVLASTSLFNDRTIIQGYFGYVDDKNQSDLSSQFIGDFSVEQKLNDQGTWRLKVFNVTNQDELRNASRNSPYAQGVAVIYKQDFNNRKDLADSFKRTRDQREEKKKKKTGKQMKIKKKITEDH